MDWLKANLWEIKQSSTLRWFGFLLAISHLITFGSWIYQNHPPLIYYLQTSPMCWSSFENCAAMRVLSHGQFEVLYFLYPFLALLAGLFFVSVRLYLGGWIFLFLAFLFKLGIYFQDSRLSSNAHYLLLVAHFVYLFIPQKKSILKYLLVSFMVASGFLKLNSDWLSGNWIHHHTDFNQKVCEWIAALSSLAELILPWLLVSRKSQNIVLGFLGLLLYYIGYWLIGESFSSTIYLLFLLYYPIFYMEQRRIEMEYLYQSYIRPEASRAWIPFALFIFWTLQALPFVKYQNPNINRITAGLALEQVYSTTECYQASFAIFNKEIREILPPSFSENSHGEFKQRNCDPFTRFLEVKLLCREMASENGFLNIASSFLLRKLGDKNFGRAFESTDICNESINFRTVGSSEWNLKKEN